MSARRKRRISTRTILIILLAIVIVGGGYYLVTNYSETSEDVYTVEEIVLMIDQNNQDIMSKTIKVKGYYYSNTETRGYLFTVPTSDVSDPLSNVERLTIDLSEIINATWSETEKHLVTGQLIKDPLNPLATILLASEIKEI